MSYHWIDQADALERHLGALPLGTPLCLDTEFMRERTFWPRLALVQLNVEGRLYLIDAPALADHPVLIRLLTRHPLVMHGCSEDVEAIRVFAGASPVEVRDTQVAAALCGADLQCSYQRLVREHFGVELPKDATRTDWLKRPLSPQQLAYAKDDVVWLPKLMEVLQARLAALGRESWWQEECDSLLSAGQSDQPSPDAWKQVKGAGSLEGGALARLVVLAAWRDRVARERDLPRSFIIKDPVLLALSLEAPGDAGALQQYPLHASVLRRDGQTLLELIREGSTQTPPAPLPGPPDAEQRAAVKRLRGKAESVAKSLGLEVEVLVRRRWLEALARQPQMLPAPLEGWRHELIGRPLQEMLINE